MKTRFIVYIIRIGIWWVCVLALLYSIHMFLFIFFGTWYDTSLSLPLFRSDITHINCPMRHIWVYIRIDTNYLEFDGRFSYLYSSWRCLFYTPLNMSARVIYIFQKTQPMLIIPLKSTTEYNYSIELYRIWWFGITFEFNFWQFILDVNTFPTKTHAFWFWTMQFQS